MFNSMFRSTLLILRAIITLPLITTVLLIITPLLIIMRPLIIIIMVIFITLIMTDRTAERTTGTLTGGMLTFN